jgi:hypothetical protein
MSPQRQNDPYDQHNYGSFGSAEIATLETGRKAVAELNKNINRWFEIGEAIEVIRQKAERMNERKAFKRIMRMQGFSMDPDSKVIDKSMVSKLKQVCDRKVEVIAWHETLTPKQKREWSAPNTVLLHCPIFAKADSDQVKKPTPLALANQSIVNLEEQNLRLKRELDRRGDGDLWKPSDTANDIAKVMVTSLTASKAAAVAKRMLKLLAEDRQGRQSRETLAADRGDAVRRT